MRTSQANIPAQAKPQKMAMSGKAGTDTDFKQPKSVSVPVFPRGAYDYLHKSVQSFMSARQVAQELARAGLVQVQTQEMTFGVVALCRGTKP